MFIITRADGKFWDGYGWGTKGKAFCSIGGATRSLHEEGEPLELATFLSKNGNQLETLITADNEPA